MPSLTNAQAIAFEYFLMAWMDAGFGWSTPADRVALPLVVKLGSVSRIKEATLKALAKKGVLRIESYSLPGRDSAPVGTLYCVKKGAPAPMFGTVTPYVG